MSKRKFVRFAISFFDDAYKALGEYVIRLPEYVDINVDMIEWFGVNENGDAIVKMNDGTIFVGADTGEIYKIEEAVYGHGADVVICPNHKNKNALLNGRSSRAFGENSPALPCCTISPTAGKEVLLKEST